MASLFGVSIADVFGEAKNFYAAKEQAKAEAKNAQRDFELAKIRAQAEANRPAVMPGVPSETMGGTGLAPSVPTWALVGAGVGLLLIVLLSRK